MAPTIIDSLIDDDVKMRRISETLKTLGNPIRLKIIACLSEKGELTVSQLVDALKLPQAIVSQQLTRLRLTNQVYVRTEKGFRFYGLSVPQIKELIECLVRCCESIRLLKE